ncbi:potassium transporter TrkG [Mycoplasmoides pneumoniae]|uniref:potassium transporter TrkG n=1 Tax=Mycoplasmoides pneumoniae TaxID=2104 RepID=UPI00132FE8A7|nr:potassium transporter TrkG [Mycoplasmoides pneumoniae]
MTAAHKQKAKLLAWLKLILWGDSISQRIFHFYIYCILLGAVLLFLPFALKTDYQKVISYEVDLQGHTISKQTASYGFLDALFLAVSAFSDTGLSTTVVSETYSVFGQTVLAILLQLGGIGFVVIAFLVWRLFKLHKKGKYSFYEKLMLQSERGGSKLGTTSEMIVVSVLFLFMVELLYGFLYTILFYFIPAFESASVFQSGGKVSNQLKALIVDSTKRLPVVHNLNLAFQYGFFHSLSAVNNAGIDLLGANSFAPYRTNWGIVIQWLAISQIIFGGIGYPVLFDAYEAIKKRRLYGKYYKHQFSLFTKLAVLTNLIVTAWCFLMLLMVEFIVITSLTNTIAHLNVEKAYLVEGLKNKSNQELQSLIFGPIPAASRVMQLWFGVISSRSAGFSVFPWSAESDIIKGIMVIAMFIGGSPSSTAGGIRTTTLAVIFLTLKAKFRGQKEVKVFKRSIDGQTVINAFLVAVFGLVSVVLIAILLPLSMQQPLSFVDSLFETTSAFGTVGLSSGATKIMALEPTRNLFNYLTLGLLMIMGQVGVSSSVLTFVKKHPQGNSFSYPREDVKVG